MTASLPMIECLLEAADRALYQMKCSGGGGVIAPPDSTPGWAALRGVYSNTSRKKSTVVCHDLASVLWMLSASGVLSPEKASGSNVTL